MNCLSLFIILFFFCYPITAIKQKSNYDKSTCRFSALKEIKMNKNRCYVYKILFTLAFCSLSMSATANYGKPPDLDSSLEESVEQAYSFDYELTSESLPTHNQIYSFMQVVDKSKDYNDVGTEPLNLKNTNIREIWQIALAKNRTILNSAYDIDSADASVAQARAIHGARITGNYQQVRMDEALTGPTGTAMGKRDTRNAYLEITQPVYLSGKDRAAVNSARLGRDLAGSGYMLTTQNILYQTTLRWLNWLFVKEAYKVSLKDHKLAKAHHALVSARYKHKQASRFEVLRADVRLAQAKSDLRKQKNSKKLAALDLLDLLDLPHDTTINTKERLHMVNFMPNFKKDSAEASKLRKDIQMKKLEVKIAKESLAAARSENKPVISIFGQKGIEDPSSKSLTFDRESYWRAGITANFTLSDGGMRRGKVKESRIAIDRVQNELKKTISRAQIEIKQAYLNINTAEEIVKAQAKGLSQAQEALRLAAVRYSNGLITQVELFDTENAYLATRLQYLQAILSYHQAYISYRFATGHFAQNIIASSLDK